MIQSEQELQLIITQAQFPADDHLLHNITTTNQN
jgi:hypothetical protein